MLKKERHQYILNKLDQSGRVVVNDLTIELNVTKDTIRKDLQELSRAGSLIRVHGGAMKNDTSEKAFDKRSRINLNKKIKLGLEALNYLKNDSVIFIDSSTTNLELVKQIPLSFNATVITNSPIIALQLKNHNDIEVYVLPGYLNKESGFLKGTSTIEAISKIHFNLCILGISAIDLEKGISVPTLEEAYIKKQVIKQSEKIISLVTPEKFETVSTHYIDQTDILDLIISTSDLSDYIKDFYSDNNINLVIV